MLSRDSRTAGLGIRRREKLASLMGSLNIACVNDQTDSDLEAANDYALDESPVDKMEFNM